MTAAGWQQNVVGEGGVMRWLIVSFMALASCQQFDEFAEAKEKVSEDLKDPSSSQFRNLVAYDDGLICGELNAKNSYGGYVGYNPFYVDGDEVVVHAPTGDELIDATSKATIINRCARASLDGLKRQ